MGHCACVVSWGVFTEQQPELASQGRSLLYQHDVGLGFLATVRRHGRPRVHPMCPLISGDGLFAFIVSSPKQIALSDAARTRSIRFHPPRMRMRST